MTDVFKLQGDFSTEPSGGSCSSSVNPSIESRIDERLSVSGKVVADYTLASDSPQAIAFNGLTGVAVLILKVPDGKVTLTATSADGTAQTIPVDGFLCVISRKTPYTALTLTREAGVETHARVFLGQLAS